MDVSDVLRDRMHEPAGLQRMVVVSTALHAMLATAIILAPARFLGKTIEAPRNVMVISIGGGGEGQRTGGMTSIGGRPVQVQTPPEETPKREAVRAPAAKVPEMTLPKPGVKPTKAAPAPNVRQAPDEARGRTPTKGAKVEAGTAVAFTGARGQGFGLASGGGPGSGSTLDVADFCCPDYIVLMMERIRSAWNRNQGAIGVVTVKFTVQRNGAIANASVETGSGSAPLDLAALRAVVMTKTLPPLPDPYPNSTLGVHLSFKYE
jgi:TonB family protein